MKRICLIILVFLFCSGFMGIDRWYVEYGITSGDELESVDVVPKLIAALNSNKARHVHAAAEQIEKFGKTAGNYFPQIVHSLSNETILKNERTLIVVANAAIAIYEDGNYSKELEVLVLTELLHEGSWARHSGLRHVSAKKVYTETVVSTLELLSTRDTDIGVREVATKVLNRAKLDYIANGNRHGALQTVLDDSPFNFSDSLFIAENNPHAIAVVIGNMNYTNSKKSVPNVDYATNDAREIRDFLTKVKGYKEGNIIYLENATQADMVSTFGNKDNFKGKLFNWVRPESDVFVYYSGHGAPSLRDGTGYLLPVDADPATVELNGYPLDTLYHNIAELPAKSVTLVIDACFSGSSQSGTVTRNASSISLRPIAMPAAGEGINVLSAANVNEIASWDTEAQHSLFTSYFIKALSGAADKKPYGNEDRRVDLAEVKNYVNAEVTYAARRNYGRDQNPQISGNPGFVFSSLKE